jgi:hypothetical protein
MSWRCWTQGAELRVGLSNIYSFRPHTEHLYYLSTLLQRAGHEVFFLTCDASVSNCYARALKGTSKWVECPKCMLGGVRSFPVAHVSRIGRLPSSLGQESLDRLALSSSCTLTRTETDDQWFDDDVVRVRSSLRDPVSMAYESARRWIDQNRLEAMICFNGRMDLTRALTFACEQSGIPYLTHERTWFGDGLHLIPNANCLSFAPVSAMAREFRHKPLNPDQAGLAGKLAGERFLQRNSLEWRVYNKNPEPSSWPLTGAGPRVLVLPSSRNEFAGHDEWKSGWPDNTQALDDFFEAFSIKPEQVVVRCHPNWAESIGQVSGERSSELYRHWTRARQIYCIPSEGKASTYDLIQQADIVVMNGGSSAVEAGVCGKIVVCLSPVNYQDAGFVQVFRDRNALDSVKRLQEAAPEEIIRNTMRFLYLSARRFPQFANHVRALQTTQYQYFDGADPDRLVSMLQTGVVSADDADFAADTAAEDQIVAAIVRKEWGPLAGFVFPRPDLPPLDIGRRQSLRWLDGVRNKLPLGDR